MAIAYESISTVGFSSTSGGSSAHSLVITKPSGLTAGDLMICIMGTRSSDDVNEATGGADVTMVAAGWSILASASVGSAGNYNYLASYGKIATSGDAAASDFTVFSVSAGVSNGWCGSILRFSDGAVPAASLYSSDTENSTAKTPTFTPGVTQTIADSILVFGIMGYDSPGTVAGYSVNTTNPTWTERVDQSGGEDTGSTFAIATGPRSPATATGDFSATFSGSLAYSSGILLCLQPITSVSATPTVITSTFSVQTTVATGSATLTTTTVTATFSAPSVTATNTNSEWTNTDKNNATWTNTPKS